VYFRKRNNSSNSNGHTELETFAVGKQALSSAGNCVLPLPSRPRRVLGTIESPIEWVSEPLSSHYVTFCIPVTCFVFDSNILLSPILVFALRAR
jgi:hypothetical protein